MAGYGNDELIREEDRNNRMFFYIGTFFVVILGLLGILILIFVVGSLNRIY